MPRRVVSGRMSSPDARDVLGSIELAGLVDGAGQPATRPNRQLPRQDFHLQERATFTAHANVFRFMKPAQPGDARRSGFPRPSPSCTFHGLRGARQRAPHDTVC